MGINTGSNQLVAARETRLKSRLLKTHFMVVSRNFPLANDRCTTANFYPALFPKTYIGPKTIGKIDAEIIPVNP
jgi:hypothetical protein